MKKALNLESLNSDKFKKLDAVLQRSVIGGYSPTFLTTANKTDEGDGVDSTD